MYFEIPPRKIVHARVALAPGSDYNFVYTLCAETKKKEPDFSGSL